MDFTYVLEKASVKHFTAGKIKKWVCNEQKKSKRTASIPKLFILI